MSQASMSSESDGANIELGASFIISTTSSSKYSKQWRKSLLYIGFLISLKKPTTSSNNYEESVEPYTSLPSSPPARTSSVKSSVSIDIVSHIQEDEEEEVIEQRIRNDIARIVKAKDLNSLLELGGVGRICDVLHGQSQHLEKSSTIDDWKHGTSFSGILWNSCKQNLYTTSMMLIAALLSFTTEFKQEGPKYGWHDGVAMIFAVLLLLGFSSVANFWRERKTMKLAKRKHQLKFKVKRGQEFFVDLAIYDIMVGDMVCLRPHDEVPVDGLLVSGDNDILVLDEGMTNEKIDCEENPFLIAGSKVIEGHGLMVVTSVRNKLNVAEIKGSMGCLLGSLIDNPISRLDKTSLFTFTLVALVMFIRLSCKKDGDGGGLPDIIGNVSIGMLMQLLKNIFSGPRGKISILAGLFSVVILSVQHGVPLMITFSLRYQNDKIVYDQDIVVNDFSACTTMGLVTVVCIDVSGGIIAKPMEVSRIWMGEGETDTSKVKESEAGLVVLDKLKQGIGLSVLAPGLCHCPVSNSLVSWAAKTWEMDIKSTRENFHILKHSRLDSNQEGYGVLMRKVRVNEQILHLHWSGAASTILEMCSQYYDCEGECHSMENQKIKFAQVIQEMEDSGLKPIAFAYRQTHEQELEQDELILLALLGIKFKCQESTKLVLKNLQNNGMHIKFVSEDDIMVVKEVACELGIEVPIDGYLEGKELQDLNDTARLVKLDQAIAMGSFSPEDKLLMVRCLQDKGDVVAFIEQRLITNLTSEVLKLADVDIVHNSLGRLMDSREISSISITCFSALEPIVKTGRSKYHNIQKFIQLQLTIGISGLLITLITTIFTGDSPLTAIQLIWVNVLMCILGGLMMVMELSSEKELTKQPPSDRNQPIITKKIWKNIVFQVLYQTSACMILEFGGHVTDSEKQVRKTMIFNTFFLCQLFNLLNIIGLLKRKVFKIVVQNYCFSVALGGCFVMQVVVIQYTEGLSDCKGLNATAWAICVLVSALSWVLEWTLKKILSVFSGTDYTTPLDSPEATPQPLFYLYWGIPFMMLLLFPLGLADISLIFNRSI